MTTPLDHWTHALDYLRHAESLCGAALRAADDAYLPRSVAYREIAAARSALNRAQAHLENTEGEAP